MFIDKNANLYNDLATLTEAGISLLDAAKKINIIDVEKQAWFEVIKDIEKGKQLNYALANKQLITPYEQEIIAVAEFSGRIPEGLREIAQSYDKRRIRVSKLKSKLYFPFAVLVIAIVVSAILSLTNDPQTSFIGVLFSSVLWIGLAIVLTKLILNLMHKDACSWLKITANFPNNQWYKMQFQQVLFGALLWQVRSGIDFKTGFIRIIKLLNNPAISKKLKQTSALCGQGKSVIESINQSQLPITKEFRQILIVAEQSGQWEYSVEKFLSLQQQSLDMRIDNAFEWAPRIYYGLVTLVAISVII